MIAELRSYKADAPAASEVSFDVRFSDVDMMQVVHHGVYLQYFDNLRFSFLEKILHIDFSALRSEGISFPVLECHLNYLQPLTFPDKPFGYAVLTVRPNATFQFRYSIFRNREDAKPCVIGSTTHCFATRDLQLLLRVPPLFRDALHTALLRYPECFRDMEESAVKARGYQHA